MDCINWSVSINPIKINAEEYRAKVVSLQDFIEAGISSGNLIDTLDSCILKHYYAPIVEDYGCGTYARELFMPQGTVIVGKIHKHSHVNILSKGKVVVMTEEGRKTIEAPSTFISQAGTKRAVYIVEDAIWTTIHLTAHLGEDKLEDMEDEIIAKSFEEIGIDTPKVGNYSFKELGGIK